MALEQKTVDEIYNLIMEQMKSEIGENIPILPKSFISIFSKVLAGVFMILYKSCSWIFLQIFVSTASFDEITVLGNKITPLIEWGRLIGIGDPAPATQAKITAIVNVKSIGSTMFSGTQFISSLNGLTYITTKSYTFNSEEETIELTCSESGSKGNMHKGDTLNISSPLSSIEGTITVNDLISVGTDRENETSYREKIKNRFQLQPQGGALSDYRQWSKEVEGVANAYIYTGEPGNVMIYILADSSVYEDRIPDDALLKKVGEYIDKDPSTGLASRRPIGAIIDPDGDKSYKNIKPIVIKEFDVEITEMEVENIEEISLKIKESLTSYYLEREPYLDGLSLPPSKNVINETNITALIDDILSASNGSFTTAINLLNDSVTPRYTLKEGEVAKLKSLKINEEIV